MNTSKAIIVASLVLGACVLVPTGYVFFHDRSVAETQRLEKERTAKAEADFITKTRAKAAWDQSIPYLATLIAIWVNRNLGDNEQFQKAFAEKKYRCIHSLSVKSYAYSDVVWNDPKTVTVKGIAIATTIDGRRKEDARTYYSWKFTYVWSDDDRWLQKPSTYKDRGSLAVIPDPGLISTDSVKLDANEEAPCQAGS
jgi:hypothetical protein